MNFLRSLKKKFHKSAKSADTYNYVPYQARHAMVTPPDFTEVPENVPAATVAETLTEVPADGKVPSTGLSGLDSGAAGV